MRTAGGGRGVRACIVVTGITLFSMGRAAAIPIVTFSGTASESYTDNVALVAQNAPQTRAWITALTPDINVTDQGRRVQFNLIYSPTELIFFAGGAPLTTLQQHLASSGQVELIKDTFFFQERASINQQFLNGFGPVGPTTYTTNSNLDTVENYLLSPILRHHFGDITDAETRFNYGQVTTSGNEFPPLQSEDLRQTFASGTDFGPLGWTLTGDATRDRLGTVPGESTPGGVLKDDLARADFRYALVRQLSVTASAGYERISFPTLVSPIVGPIWNVGFAYTPNPRLAFSATYGRRYGAPDYEVSARYTTAGSATLPLQAPLVGGAQAATSTVAPETVPGSVTATTGTTNPTVTTATLTYAETIETTSMLLLSTVSQLGFSSGLPINTVTGLPFTGNGGFGNLPALLSTASDSAFLGKFLNASLQTTRGRNTFTAYASYGTEHIYAIATSEAFYTASFNWGRSLSPRVTSNLSATYTHANFGGFGEYERIYSLLGSLAYTLSPRSAVTFSFARSDEQSNVSSLAIKDDIATVAYTRQF